MVIAAEVLEHIDEDGAAIAELFRVLRPGGAASRSPCRAGGRSGSAGRSRASTTRSPVATCASTGAASWPSACGDAGLVVAPPHHHAHALHSPYWWLRCALGMSREQALVARLYHRFLVYDLMRRPRWTRRLERALNPVLGKSVVLYARRPGASAAGSPHDRHVSDAQRRQGHRRPHRRRAAARREHPLVRARPGGSVEPRRGGDGARRRRPSRGGLAGVPLAGRAAASRRCLARGVPRGRGDRRHARHQPDRVRRHRAVAAPAVRRPGGRAAHRFRVRGEGADVRSGHAGRRTARSGGRATAGDGRGGERW